MGVGPLGAEGVAVILGAKVNDVTEFRCGVAPRGAWCGQQGQEQCYVLHCRALNASEAVDL